MPTHRQGATNALPLATTLVVAAPFFSAAAQYLPPASPEGAMLGEAAQAHSGDEAPYLAESEAAMAKRMRDMAVEPTGDVDRDFVAMMVPHHQCAIDMAIVELRYGHNDRLKRLAQEIVVTQLEEISAMRLAVGDPLPASLASPSQAPPSDQR